MPAAAIIGASVIGAGASIISGNRASSAVTQAADRSAEVQRYMYDTSRADYAPWRQVGQGALGQLARLYGIQMTPSQPVPTVGQGGVAGNYGGGRRNIWGEDGSYFTDMGWNVPQPANNNPPAAANDDPFAGFFTSPDYKFRLQEGMKAIERSAAARGGLRSGATMRSLNNYAQDTASTEYGNYVNRLAALAGVGQSATDSTTQAGMQYANGASNAYTNAGNARASAYANTGNAINQGVGNIASMYLYNHGYGGG